MTDIAIIGGGASGMAAAIMAARDPDKRVTLIERQARVGRKLLSSGNGRCNITNTELSLENYHGEDSSFPSFALDAWTPERVLDFFRELGLMCVTEHGGRVYPLSNQASSVLDVLRFALDKPNIRLLTGTEVASARRTKEGFHLDWEGGSTDCKKLIVACGGCAGSKLGGVMYGYKLLQSLGHSRTALYPSLTQLRTAPDVPRSMKGVKVSAAVTLKKGRSILSRKSGDLLFTENGVSGTVIFELSRHASAAGGAGTDIYIDFLESLSEEDTLGWLYERAAARPEAPVKEIFTGALHSRVGLALCKYAGIGAEAPCRLLEPGEMAALAAAAKSMKLPVTGVSGFEAAQVTAGGIRTSEFDPRTMESRLIPGLYACGEVLDIDGDCGGFNLQWAWASGLTAGGSL